MQSGSKWASGAVLLIRSRSLLDPPAPVALSALCDAAPPPRRRDWLRAAPPLPSFGRPCAVAPIDLERLTAGSAGNSRAERGVPVAHPLVTSPPSRGDDVAARCDACRGNAFERCRIPLFAAALLADMGLGGGHVSLRKLGALGLPPAFAPRLGPEPVPVFVRLDAPASDCAVALRASEVRPLTPPPPPRSEGSANVAAGAMTPPVATAAGAVYS